MKNLTAVCILISALIIIGCSKYEDGPGISFRTKKARLVNKWELDRFFVGGHDQAGLNPTPLHLVFWVEFKDNNTVEGDNWMNGHWDFDDSKENILITNESDSLLATLRILKLKKDELWLEYELYPSIMAEDHYISY